MGQGGTVMLLNGTKYDWILISQQSQSMNSWSFPSLLRRNGSAPQYTEFQVGGTQSGSVSYALNGTSGASFAVQATNEPDFNISVAFTNLAAPGQPAGSVLNLGWNHDGYIIFFLYGEEGNFGFSTLPVDWMHDLLPLLGARTLRELCIGGSHDSGMSTITDGTFFGNACNTITQTLGILGQLNAGARFFDIRPTLSGTTYSTGHYSGTGSILNFQGCSGQVMSSIIADVNAFTATNQELIVLYLSHDMVTSAGYVPFTQDQYSGMLQQMLGINDLFPLQNPNIDLTTQTLSSFIGNGRAAVIVVVDAQGIALGDFATKGFYQPGTSFQVDNRFTGTPDLATMQSNQYSNLQTARTTPDSPYFLLSWTLTQTSAMATRCAAPGATSILNLADEANPVLTQTLMAHCTPQSFPNVLYTDDVATSSLPQNAAAVNCLSIEPIDPRTSPPLAAVGTSAGLSVLYRGSDSRLHMATAPDGTTWGAPVELPPGINSTFTPAATAWNDTIRILYRGAPGDLTLWSGSEPNDWADTAQLPTAITTVAPPALTVMNGTLYGIFLTSAGDGTIFVASSPDGKTWQSIQMPPAITTAFPPAVTTLNGTLHVMFRSGGDLSMFMTSSTDGVHWDLNHVANNQTTYWSPSMVAFNDDVYAVYRAVADLTMWVTRYDGGNWPIVAQLPAAATTLYSPSVAAFNGALYVLYASAVDYTVWQTTSTNGVQWSTPTQLPSSIVLGP
jgi:hypothetical protein